MKRLGAILLSVFLFASCGSGDATSVRVFAAASMTDAVGELALEYAGATEGNVTTSYGASSTLARQIDDGAPADVYISASKTWVEFLQENGRLQEAPVVIARNELVCITGKDSALKIGSLKELGADSPATIAIADEGVPAGEYARQALKNSGYLEDVQASLVGQKDVRAVLKAVASGNAELGFVYATDAKAFEDSVRVAFRVDTGLHAPIEYYAALIGESQGARDFFLYIQSDKARGVLAQSGFLEP